MHRIAASPLPPARRAGHIDRSIWWAAQYVWGHDGVMAKPSEPHREPRSYLFHDERALADSLDNRPVPLQVHYGAPFEVLLQFPWEWFAAGGGVVFIAAVERWLHAPKRFRVESARLDAEYVEHEAAVSKPRHASSRLSMTWKRFAPRPGRPSKTAPSGCPDPRVPAGEHFRRRAGRVFRLQF